MDAAPCSDSSSRVRPFLYVDDHRGKGTPYPHCELHSQNGRLFFVGKGRDNSTKEFRPSEIEELRKFLSKIDENNVGAIIIQ